MKVALRLGLSAAVAAGLLWILAAWGGVSRADLLDAWRRLPASAYVTATAAHLGVYGLRALRFRVLLPRGRRPGIVPMSAVSAAHNLAAYVLPAKTGEVSFVVYLRALCGVPAGAGTAALVVGRLLDLATLGLSVCAASVWLATARPELVPGWLLPAAAVPGAAAVVLLLAALRADRLVGLGERCARAARIDRTGSGLRLLERARGLAGHFAAISRGDLALAAVLSTGMWVAVFAFFALLARGFGLPPELGPVEAAFGSSLAVLTNLLPVNALAGFGTQETGWVLGFGLLGVGRELALSTGLAVHLVQLFNTAALGALGHVVMALAPAHRRGGAGDPPVG